MLHSKLADVNSSFGSLEVLMKFTHIPKKLYLSLGTDTRFLPEKGEKKASKPIAISADKDVVCQVLKMMDAVLRVCKHLVIRF